MSIFESIKRKLLPLKNWEVELLICYNEEIASSTKVRVTARTRNKAKEMAIKAFELRAGKTHRVK